MLYLVPPKLSLAVGGIFAGDEKKDYIGCPVKAKIVRPMIVIAT